MASALRFAARKICRRAFQQPVQPYFRVAAEAAVKEEQRRLFLCNGHGGSSVRRFCSSKTPNPVNNIKHAPNSKPAAAKTETTSRPPLWKSFVPLSWGEAMVLLALCNVGLYMEIRKLGPFGQKEQSDNTGTQAYSLQKTE